MPLRFTSWSLMCLGLAASVLVGCKSGGRCATQRPSCPSRESAGILPHLFPATPGIEAAPEPVREPELFDPNLPSRPSNGTPTSPNRLPSPPRIPGSAALNGATGKPSVIADDPMLPEPDPMSQPQPQTQSRSPLRFNGPPAFFRSNDQSADEAASRPAPRTTPRVDQIPPPPVEVELTPRRAIPRIATRDTNTVSDSPVRLSPPEPFELDEFDAFDELAPAPVPEETPVFRRRSPVDSFPQPVPEIGTEAIPQNPAIDVPAPVDVPVPDPDAPLLNEQSALRIYKPAVIPTNGRGTQPTRYPTPAKRTTTQTPVKKPFVVR